MTRRQHRVALALAAMLLEACDGRNAQPSQISTSGFGAYEPALAAIDGGFAVAWNDNRHGNDEIYLRLLDSELEPTSEQLRLTQSPEISYEAALVPFAGNLAVAWYDRDPAGTLAVKLGLWNSAGMALWSTRVSAPESSGRIPALQALGDRLFIAWVEDAASADQPSTLKGAELDAAGNWKRAPFTIAPASRTTWNLNVDTVDGDGVAVVFDAETETRASELYLALVTAGGKRVARVSADDGNASKYPDIAVHSGAVALTWFDVKDGNEEVYLSSVDLGDPSVTMVDAVASVITQTPGESIGAYLAWNGATLGLAWNDNSAGQHEVFFQTFDTNLRPLAAARQITHSEAQSLIPSIVAAGDGFALAWNEAVYGNGGHGGDMGATRSEISVVAVE